MFAWAAVPTEIRVGIHQGVILSLDLELLEGVTDTLLYSMPRCEFSHSEFLRMQVCLTEYNLLLTSLSNCYRDIDLEVQGGMRK